MAVGLVKFLPIREFFWCGDGTNDAERNDAGFLRPSKMVRAANKHRVRVAWKAKLDEFSGKEFRMRFKISRRRFG